PRLLILSYKNNRPLLYSIPLEFANLSNFKLMRGEVANLSEMGITASKKTTNPYRTCNEICSF
mgnify:CR=1